MRWRRPSVRPSTNEGAQHLSAFELHNRPLSLLFFVFFSSKVLHMYCMSVDQGRLLCVSRETGAVLWARRSWETICPRPRNCFQVHFLASCMDTRDGSSPSLTLLHISLLHELCFLLQQKKRRKKVFSGKKDITSNITRACSQVIEFKKRFEFNCHVSIALSHCL